MSHDTNDLHSTLMTAINAGNMDAALSLLFGLPNDQNRLDTLRNIAEDLDAEVDTEATFAIASALNHAYVLFLNNTFPLIRDLALANVGERTNALIHAHKLTRDFADTLKDDPDQAAIFNCGVFLIRALERLLRISK
jgi:hypothetical protein